MSTLTLNGITIPVAFEKAGLSNEEVGSKERSDSGMLMNHRKADKDVGEFETTWRSSKEITALRGMVLGRGDRWTFDGSTVDEALYSSKGLYPSNDLPSGLYGPLEIVTPSFSETLPKKGTSCVAIDGGTANLLSADDAATLSPSGFSHIGTVTLAAPETSGPPIVLRSGTVGSMLVQPLTSNSGISLPLTAASGTSSYTVSFFARAQTDMVSLTATVSDGPVSLTKDIVADHWTRFELTWTGDGSAPSLSITSPPGGLYYYVAAFQLEAKDHATAWIPGGSSTSFSTLEYKLAGRKAGDGLSIMCWSRTAPMTDGLEFARPLWEVRDADGNMVVLAAVAQATAEGILLPSAVVGQKAGADDVGPLVYPLARSSYFWNHYAVTIARDGAGGIRRSLYLNGVLAATEVKVSGDEIVFAPGDAPTIVLGASTELSLMMDGQIDDLHVLPYEATAEMVTAIYEDRWHSPPFISAGGDGLFAWDDEPLVVLGEASSVSQTTGVVNGSLATVRKLGFKLTER
jgi:hypothetical protein